jgi:hypothetical protein
MQLTVLAAQNAVPVADLGVATSSVNFSRSIGGSVGVALFGALFNARLSEALGGGTVLDLADLRALPEAARQAYVVDFADALTGTFAFAVPVMLLAVVLAVAQRELPLRTGVDVEAVPEPV